MCRVPPLAPFNNTPDAVHRNADLPRQLNLVLTAELLRSGLAVSREALPVHRKRLLCITCGANPDGATSSCVAASARPRTPVVAPLLADHCRSSALEDSGSARNATVSTADDATNQRVAQTDHLPDQHPHTCA